MEPVSKKTHWVTSCDESGDYLGKMVGSREGLLHLRAQIDEALEKGSVEISKEVDFDFVRISVQDAHPRDTVRAPKASESFLKYGCLGTLIILVYLVGMGAYHVFLTLTR